MSGPAEAKTSRGDRDQSLLDVDQVAERLGVKVSLVRRLVLERRIPFVKLAKYVRFDPADIDAWVAEAKVTPGRHHGGPPSAGGGR